MQVAVDDTSIDIFLGPYSAIVLCMGGVFCLFIVHFFILSLGCLYSETLFPFREAD